MATFTWTVSRLDCYPQSDGKTNMVFNVKWSCSGIQEFSGSTYTAEFNSMCFVPYNPDHHWVEYADLTKEEVLEWVWENGVNQTEIEAAVQQRIDEQINPPTVSLPLPWAE